MNSFQLVIATRNRIAKLERTLSSVPELDYQTIVLVCDGDEKTFEHFKNYRRDITIRLVPIHMGSVFCRNVIIKDSIDGVLYATDDITFSESSIQKAFELFNNTFPDDDGVVGFKQNRSSKDCPTGVALVGKEFIKRYPKRNMFYPKYYHFCAQEVSRLCEKLEKNVFVTSNDLLITHYHPAYIKEEMDQTHRDARVHRAEDRALSSARRKSGEIWGDSNI